MPSRPKNPDQGPVFDTERVRALRDVWVTADRMADAKARVREWGVSLKQDGR